MITERDVAVVSALAKFYVLSRQQIQRLCFAEDKNGRVTRRRLQTLVAAAFLHRHSLFPYHPLLGAPAPVYYPSRRGLEFLAEHFSDERYLVCNTQPPNPSNLLHWLAISDTRITIEASIASQKDVELLGWINEFDVVNKDESRPEKRFCLYTLLRESPRLVCAPDAALLLCTRGFKKVFYLEQDRNTSGVHQLAASRPKGYAELLQQQLHRRHFPATNIDTFSVMMVVPSETRREALKKAFRSVPAAHLWKFVSERDLTPQSFLHGSIFHPCEGEPTPLIRAETTANKDKTE